MNQTIIFALFVMAMLIVVCVGYSASQAWRSLLVEQRLNQIKGSGDSRLVRWEDLLTLIARPLRRSRDLAAVERSMQQAGFIKPWQTDLFLLFRALVLIAAAVGGWLAIDIDPTHLVQKPLPPLAYLFLLFVAGRAPGWFLSELAERRQNRIRLFIPKAVDLLTICMSCGMSLEEAFDRVASEIARRAPEVAKEFRMTRYEMLVVNRTVALKRLEARSGVREMKILANSLLQSIQYGTPLTEALQSIAAEARAGQLSELEQKAGRISAVIGVPLIVLVLFPASLSLLLCSALLSGCVVTNDYIAFDSKAAPSPQIKRYDGNEWASERAVMVAAEKTNNWQTVISVGNDVIAKNPTNVEARIYLARAFTKMGDPRQALRVLSFISGVDTAELRIERARALIALTDFEEAVKLLKPLTDGSDLQKLSAEDRRSAKSLAAVAYSMSKNYAAADKLYEELLAELDNPIIRYNYARSLYLEGRAEDSLAQLQPIIDQVPAAKPAAVAALMKLGRENDVRRLLKGELDDEKIEELISAIKEKTK